jgi:hypothetical protein
MNNKTKFTKEEIIMALRSKSQNSSPEDNFQKGLLKNLETKLDSQEDSKDLINLIVTFMNRQKALFMVVFALLLTLGAAGWYYGLSGLQDLDGLEGDNAFAPGSSDEANEDSAAGSDTSLSMKVALVQWDTLAEAEATLTFDLRTPSEFAKGASLTLIETAANEQTAKNDQLYLTYGKGEDVTYKMFIGKSFGAYEEGVAVTIDGVTGQYFEVENWEELNTPDAIAFDGGSSPRSYIYWEKDGIYYEVSEFGTLTKEEMIELGNSMK